MNSYSATHVFSDKDINYLTDATMMIQKVEEHQFDKPIRCHELARAVGRVLEFTHQDGQYLSVDHTWLWLQEDLITEGQIVSSIYPKILDVYAIGVLPQVQIMDSPPGLPLVGTVYKPGPERSDIDTNIVEQLICQMTARPKGLTCRVCGTGCFGGICKRCNGEPQHGRR